MIQYHVPIKMGLQERTSVSLAHRIILVYRFSFLILPTKKGDVHLCELIDMQKLCMWEKTLYHGVNV